MKQKAARQHEMLSDDEIIGLYLNRDDSAIRHTSEKYGRLLYRIAYGILHDSGDSEECENDAYNGIWNAIPPAKPEVFPAFITQIVRHIAYDRYKEKNRRKRVPSALTVSLDELYKDTGTEIPSQEAGDGGELAALLDAFLRGLDDRSHFEFIGRYYLAHTVGELAGELGVTASTVYRDLASLRLRLKDYLERNGVYV